MKKIFLAGTAMLLAGAGAAIAADALPAPYVEAPVYEAPVQTVSAAGGWYLRGDVGYSWNKMKGAEFFQGGLGTYAPFATASLRNSYSIGGGVGYQINEKLRTDVTLDYFAKANFRGSTIGSCGVATACTSTDITSVSGLSLLANAYVDLYKKGRFTFYAGGGLGGTRVKWDDLNNTSCSTATPTLCDPSFNHGGAAGWRFTYALMAGASIDVTCAVKADVGYRYRHISGGNMFKSLTSNGYQGQHKAITSHEVRGGLRYGFGGCEQEVYVEPAPIMPVVYK
ncbi:opacity protein-like surface antigen [Hoeflea halophila]|uniref:Opacity protein-like surface antigen n=1 Tax=Hoeflea halophila TaxID=714899 RepID=A0A286I829_9HYPH|nr:outer membrane protein [Hoeflea halophila]SOE16283.1 opacity protein-like surface antigen [Hoeflea halophila]